MNRIRHIACLLLLFLVACDNYLEESPDNRVELNTLDKAAQLLTNAYSEAGYNFKRVDGRPGGLYLRYAQAAK